MSQLRLMTKLDRRLVALHRRDDGVALTLPAQKPSRWSGAEGSEIPEDGDGLEEVALARSIATDHKGDAGAGDKLL